MTPRRASVLAFGLPSDSRIKLKLSGARVPTETVLLAACLDKLNLLAWQNTEDARHGRNVPRSILAELLEDKPKEQKIKKFKTGREFDEALARLQGSG